MGVGVLADGKHARDTLQAKGNRGRGGRCLQHTESCNDRRCSVQDQFLSQQLHGTVVVTHKHIEVFVSCVACFLYLKAIVPGQSLGNKRLALQ